MDADFCGLWGSKDPNDPVVTKSRIGYVIMLMAVGMDCRYCVVSCTEASTVGLGCRACV